ncbi:hypothetical protein [Paenibacillus senegalimassiliensis]|uniref:hypothetical protein n=1 Tax=Paenibacillus senegalimassiliensis TaxID=1737426 RepID=UPI001CA368C6|nr:hypothetical protein [Paenibacillus senegalimassiliensis]
MSRIISLSNFKLIKARGHGYVTITDKYTGNCVHHVVCNYVAEHNFTQKVLENAQKNGAYFFTEDLNQAMNHFPNMRKCQKCFKS